MDLFNFLPQIAAWLHIAPSQLLFWLGFITFAANAAARLIPADATGWLGTARKVAAFIGVYISSRVTTDPVTGKAVKSTELAQVTTSFPEVQAKITDAKS